MQVREFPTIRNKWVLKQSTSILENAIEYDVMLSGDLPGEEGWCAVAIDVKKEYEDFVGEKIFEGSVTSSFKIKYKKEQLTTKMLYDLMKIAGQNFSEAFTELIKGTSLEGAKIARPLFEDYERYLNRVIQDSN